MASERAAYRAVYGSFWTGDTGRALKKCGPACQVLAAYLITSPHSNMAGVYYLPLTYIGQDTGLDFNSVCEGLAKLERLGFAVYDHATEWVWVCGAIDYQVNLRNSKQVAGARTLVERCGSSELLTRVLARHGAALGCPPQDPPVTPAGGMEDPSMTLPSPMDDLGITEKGIRDQGSGRETETGTGEGSSLSASVEGDVWEEWREVWASNPKRTALRLTPKAGEFTHLTEIARRFPDATLRRRLIACYFTTPNRKIRENPYTLGWFLRWADRLAEELDAAESNAAKEREFLAS